MQTAKGRLWLVLGFVLSLAFLTHLFFLVTTHLWQEPESLAEEQPLLLGTNIWPGYEPFYLARELGLLPDKAIRLAEFSSTSEVMRAFQNGSIQLAATTLDEAILLAEKEVPFQVILVADVSQGGDCILARPEFPDLHALKGKRIGVERSALGAYVLHRALELRQLKQADFTLISVNADRHQEAYLKGFVEAVVTFEPSRSQLMAQGAKEVFSSNEIPGEVIDILIADPAVLKSHPAQVAALLEAWFQAVQLFQQEPDRVAPLMAARMGIAQEQVGAAFAGLVFPDLHENLRLMQGAQPPLSITLHKLSQVMQTQGLLEESISLTQWFDVTPLEQVHP